MLQRQICFKGRHGCFNRMVLPLSVLPFFTGGACVPWRLCRRRRYSVKIVNVKNSAPMTIINRQLRPIRSNLNGFWYLRRFSGNKEKSPRHKFIYNRAVSCSCLSVRLLVCNLSYLIAAFAPYYERWSIFHQLGCVLVVLGNVLVCRQIHHS